MSYNKQLNLIIENSGKSLKEIAIECKKEGVDITQSYIGILKNNEDRIPSEEVSNAIAKVCGANPEILIIEGGFDKAPKATKNKMEIIKNCYREMVKNNKSKEEKRMIDEKFDDIPYSVILDSLILATQYSLEKITERKINQFTEKLKEYEILTDNLEPRLIKGSKVKLITIPLNRYKQGDILVYKKADRTEYKEIIAIEDNEIILRDNNGYYAEDLKEIKELGIIDVWNGEPL